MKKLTRILQGHRTPKALHLMLSPGKPGNLPELYGLEGAALLSLTAKQNRRGHTLHPDHFNMKLDMDRFTGQIIESLRHRNSPGNPCGFRISADPDRDRSPKGNGERLGTKMLAVHYGAHTALAYLQIQALEDFSGPAPRRAGRARRMQELTKILGIKDVSPKFCSCSPCTRRLLKHNTETIREYERLLREFPACERARRALDRLPEEFRTFRVRVRLAQSERRLQFAEYNPTVLYHALREMRQEISCDGTLEDFMQRIDQNRISGPPGKPAALRNLRKHETLEMLHLRNLHQELQESLKNEDGPHPGRTVIEGNAGRLLCGVPEGEFQHILRTQPEALHSVIMSTAYNMASKVAQYLHYNSRHYQTRNAVLDSRILQVLNGDKDPLDLDIDMYIAEGYSTALQALLGLAMATDLKSALRCWKNPETWKEIEHLEDAIQDLARLSGGMIHGYSRKMIFPHTLRIVKEAMRERIPLHRLLRWSRESNTPRNLARVQHIQAGGNAEQEESWPPPPGWEEFQAHRPENRRIRFLRNGEDLIRTGRANANCIGTAGYNHEQLTFTHPIDTPGLGSGPGPGAEPAGLDEPCITFSMRIQPEGDLWNTYIFDQMRGPGNEPVPEGNPARQKARELMEFLNRKAGELRQRARRESKEGIKPELGGPPEPKDLRDRNNPERKLKDMEISMVILERAHRAFVPPALLRMCLNRLRQARERHLELHTHLNPDLPKERSA